MQLATVVRGNEETAAVRSGSDVRLLSSINEIYQTTWPTDVFALIQPEHLSSFQHWWGEKTQEEKNKVPAEDRTTYGPLYRHPRKIWGIGLNYVDHASDLNEKAPQSEPASFMKPDTTIIGHKDTICIPHQSERTTAEAELGIVIGQKCKDVDEADAASVIAGYTTIIDMTAEDILQRNPRYLTRSKSFDTFFSFGPVLYTPDEVEDVMGLNVSTVINGDVHQANQVSNMTFDPFHLISFHSKVMTLLPGDIISTGTPGAAVIRDGDVMECRIDGFEPLRNEVKDLKGKE
ncbi:fumarylacetoacetate hydrolase family protein [Halobacillus litoralis]|uniref:fumarylacetoacetate hydrolase family protein n=1 Tax=Halobacillus litoralis TaxID=45668 RepID=UPI001CD54722|nr:fumarylacetoacetate hydrolase family protein [Halobacillus litoralis]MCA0971387.1 fumarylacetoacetate hydrolase family protein [Halobacillus litoralis]